MKRRVPKRTKIDPFWESRPEWAKKVDLVMKLMARDFPQDQIIAITNIPELEVRRIMEEEDYVRDVVVKNAAESVPLMKRIRSMGLEVLNSFMKDLMDPEVRSRLVNTVKDAVAVRSLISDMTMLIRLEEDKSTSNISMETHATKEIIHTLQNSDPIFAPPAPIALPEPTEKIIIELPRMEKADVN